MPAKENIPLKNQPFKAYPNSTRVVVRPNQVKQETNQIASLNNLDSQYDSTDRDSARVNYIQYKEPQANKKPFADDKEDVQSIISETTSIGSYYADAGSRRFLSGFHPYYDKVNILDMLSRAIDF